MKNNIISWTLVIVQFTCIGILVYLNSFSRNFGIAFIIGLISLLIGFLAIFNMRKSKLTVSPVPRDKAILIENGIYKWIRHPMYLAVLLFCLSLIWGNFTKINLLIYIILGIDLLLKLHWEEKLLLKKFGNYREYRSRTKKLLPFIF